MKLVDFVAERVNKLCRNHVITAEIINNYFESALEMVEAFEKNSIKVDDAIDYIMNEEGFHKKFKYGNYAGLIREFLNYVKRHKDKEVIYIKVTDKVGNIIKKIVEEDYYL